MNVSPSDRPRRQYAFDVERAIVTWRGFLEGIPSLSKDDLDELEDHVRNEIETLRRQGFADATLFREALSRIGDIATLDESYGVVLWEKRTRKDRIKIELHGGLGLLGSYVKTAWRGIVRQKVYAFLNISGLAVALSASLVIGVFIEHSLSFDRSYENADRIFRLETLFPGGSRYAKLSVGLANRIRDLYPEVESATETSGWRSQEHWVTIDDKDFQVDQWMHADPDFLDIFSVDVLRGDALHALAEPETVVLTESTARRLFGDEDPIGRTLQFDVYWNFTVTAVVADPPVASSYRFNAIAFRKQTNEDVNWYSNSVRVFVRLVDATSHEALEEKLNELVREEEPTYWEGGGRIFVVPITSVHLHSMAQLSYAPSSDIRYLYLFGGIGLLILTIACINYMNLATARSALRAREVGVRKVAGASRRQLARQFLGESLLLVLMALPPALFLAYIALPFVNGVTGESMSIGSINNAAFWSGVIFVLCTIGIVGGSYPALLLSGFRPTTVFKGNTSLGRPHRAARKMLVGFQVVASFALIVGTLLFTAQMDYIRTSRLGFDQSQVVMLNAWNWDRGEFESFKERVSANPGIRSVAAGMPLGVGRVGLTTGGSYLGLADEGRTVAFIDVGYDYVETMEIEVLSGRSFSRDFPGDEERGVLLTDALVTALGIEGNPVGQTVNISGEWTIVGVVSDFRNKVLRGEGLLKVLALKPDNVRDIAVRLNPGYVQEGLRVLETAWKELETEPPFEYVFLDEKIQKQYTSESRLANIFGIFAGLSIFVACLGLFGLAAFSAEQRTKEIGVRKALGATVRGIVMLLSKDYLATVLVGVVITTPLAFILGNLWLENFRDHVEIGPSLILGSAAVVLGFVLVAVSYQSLKAALANPTDALRHE